MKILFEKYRGKERLDSWTHVFNNIDEVIGFMALEKDHVLGMTSDNYNLKISVIKE